MKTKTLLIAAVMFLGLTAGAFAQATYQVGSIPVTAVIETGLTERSGDITFSQVSGQSLQGTVAITYGGTPGVPITVDDTKILILAPPGAPGYSSGVAAPPSFPPGTTISTVTVNSLDNESGVLVLNVPAGVAAGSFTVSGVRVAVAGVTVNELRANISSTNNAILAGQTSVVVITDIAPGIDDVSTSSSDRVNLNATTGTPVSGDNTTTIRVDEGFLNAFNDINPATNFGVGIRFTLTGIPEGITVTFPATATTNGNSPLGVPTFISVDDVGITPVGAVAIDANSDSLSVFYRLTSTSDPTTLERLSVPVTITFTGDEDEDLPLAAGPIQFTTTLWPTGTAFDDGDVITLNRLIPRYVESLIGPDTLANISAATSTLLVPFAQRIEELGYDTGLAVANATADPEDLSEGIEAGVRQSGLITFHFFATLPSPSGTMPDVETYTTQAGSPGTGLDAAGRLPAGSTYIVLLSELLEAADLDPDFAGHVYIVTNFTDAHCLFVVSNFTTFSQGALALVLRDPRGAGLDQ